MNDNVPRWFSYSLIILTIVIGCVLWRWHYTECRHMGGSKLYCFFDK